MKYEQKLSEMIKCETISNNDMVDRAKFHALHMVLHELFPSLHNVCEKHDFNGSLLYKWKGKSDKSPILLMSHMDVVEAQGEWKYPPFSGEIADGRVWGRGSVDTKGSLFCILQAVEELSADGFVPPTDVYIASSCTEEIGGEGAPETARYLHRNGVRLRFLIDEGGIVMDRPISLVHGKAAMVGTIEKGYGDLRFVARGHGGHSSAPPKNSPVARLAAFINYVESHSVFKSEFLPAVSGMFMQLAPLMDRAMRFVFSNIGVFKPILKKIIPSVSDTAGAMLKTTIAFTQMSGSQGSNVLPQEASVTANMRFIPHQSTDESIKLITEIAKRFDVETEILKSETPSKQADVKGDAFAYLASNIKKCFGDIAVAPYVMVGGTDARYYDSVCDCCLRFAPLEVDQQQFESIHASDENINISALTSGVAFYKSIIEGLSL